MIGSISHFQPNCMQFCDRWCIRAYVGDEYELKPECDTYASTTEVVFLLRV